MPCLEQVLIWSCRQSLEMQQVAVNWKQSNQSCVQAAAILTPRTRYDCNNICACHVWCYIIYTNIDYHVLYTYKHIHATILHINNFMWQLFLQRWFTDVYIHTYTGTIIIIIIYKHIIIYIPFIYNTIHLNVLYSSSNSSSFWTSFEQRLNKFVSILVVMYIVSKWIYNRKEDNL